MTNTVVELYGGQDFIIHEEDYRTTRIEGILTTGGVPVAGGTALSGIAAALTVHTNAGDPVTGILVHACGSGATEKVAVMVNGPAVVDGSSLMDSTGAALDAAGLAAVAALGIKLAKEADLIEEGKPAI